MANINREKWTEDDENDPSVSRARSPMIPDSTRPGQPHRDTPPRGLFITDFDGTLAGSDGIVSELDRAALRRLGEFKIPRVVATGRSLFSFRRAPIEDLPLDYVIFSTGGGVAVWPEGTMLASWDLAPSDTARAEAVLRERGLDFMIHDPLPDNHRFAWHGNLEGNPDLARRVTLYAGHCRPLDGHPVSGPAAQLLAILPDGADPAEVDRVRKALPGLTVVRTTSPLDGRSLWIEIFPKDVSKSLTSARLARRLGIPREATCAVGNDFNDVDLLDWAGRAFVTANAPDELHARYEAVAGHDEGGVAEAVTCWLEGDPDPGHGDRGT